MMMINIAEKKFIWIIVVLFGLSVFAAGYFAYHSFFTPEALKRREVKKWAEIIGKNTELPHGETPTLATVTNKEKLGDQKFFQKAENGDKILIYPLAKQAYLFRPSLGKIIEVTTNVSIERE